MIPATAFSRRLEIVAPVYVLFANRLKSTKGKLVRRPASTGLDAGSPPVTMFSFRPSSTPAFKSRSPPLAKLPGRYRREAPYRDRPLPSYPDVRCGHLSEKAYTRFCHRARITSLATSTEIASAGGIAYVRIAPIVPVERISLAACTSAAAGDAAAPTAKRPATIVATSRTKARRLAVAAGQTSHEF
jgi:hypothetical protein